jgi:DNA-directed RNA polymerase
MDLLGFQRGLEDASLAIGGQRFRRKLEAAVSSHVMSGAGAAKRLLREGIDPLELAIEEMIKDPSRNPPCQKWCELLGPAAAAFMTLKVVLDSLALRRPLRKVANDISGLILDELRWREFRKSAPNLFRYRMDGFHTSSYRHRKNSLDATAKWAGINTKWLEHMMSPREKVKVGVGLVDLLIESTRMVEVTTDVLGGPRPTGMLYLEPTDETLEWIYKRNEFLEYLSPVTFPMVVEPIPWRVGIQGGYRFALKGKHTLVRRRHQHASDCDAQLAVASMPEVYDALNSVQSTPWKINDPVWQFVQEAWKNGKAVAGLPSLDPVEVPTRPRDIGENAEARRKWRDAAHEAHELDYQRRVKVKEAEKILGTARRMSKFERFYFPSNLDFRGRMYPISDYLSPQGTDLSRGLLYFADGMPLGVEGAYWLAIAGANLMDVDPETGLKLSTLDLDQRVEWVMSHMHLIIAVADNPWDTLDWWGQADNPLQFLAFCYEEQAVADHGLEYVSGFPVSQDGTCSGLQHFAALFRDEGLAASTNMLPQRLPSDQYQVVADKVDEILRASAEGVAKVWLRSGLIDRALVKRPTMTFGYGARKYGFTKQILEYLQQKDQTSLIGGTRAEVKFAAAYLAGIVWEALETAVKAAHDAMQWMRFMSRAITSTSNLPIRWHAPTGFPVYQEYYKCKRHQVRTILAGKVIKPSVYTATDETDSFKQVNAISPNVIHSYDAAALCKTVCLAAQRGVSSFGMVHDSYSTVPACVGILGDATREAFVGMYEESDVIGELDKELKEQYKGEDILPSPPDKGRLDLERVLNAPYFFS